MVGEAIEFEGVLLDGEVVVVPAVRGTYWITENGGLKSWQGTIEDISVNDAAAAFNRGKLTLRLPNGSTGKLHVSKVGMGSNRPTTCSFTGSGKPPIIP